MKYHGCTVEFTDERNADLMRAYRSQLAALRFVKLADLGRRIVEMPSKRFWVSEERAKVVVSAIMAGRPVLGAMRPSKREMFLEIHRRVVELMQSQPSIPFFDAVCQVVNSPAPKFYMDPRSAIETIYKIKNGFYQRQFRRACRGSRLP